MPVIGTPAFNAVTLLKIDAINFATVGAGVVGHGAFVNTSTGKTYGQTTCQHWSQRTLEKLNELRAAMEEDLAALVFASNENSSGIKSPTLDPGGIGEALRGAGDAPQV